MRSAQAEAPQPLLLLGVVRGPVAEGSRVVDALGAFRPDLLAIGLSPEEVRALQLHFSDPYSEPWVPLASAELAYARGLARFGPVRVPSPAFLATLGWAGEHGVEVQGIEPPDDTYSELFLEHVGYFDLLRRTLADRKLQNAPPEAEDPEAFAVRWDARTHPGRGSRRLLEARGRMTREALLKLCKSGGSSGDSASLKNRVALVVDVERFDPLLHELREARWSALQEPPRLSAPPSNAKGRTPSSSA